MEPAPLTNDEHTARAMLMGRIYIDWLHVYVVYEEWRSSQMHGTESIWLDADSLELVPHSDKLDRLIDKATLKAARQGKAPDPETYKYVFERMVR